MNEIQDETSNVFFKLLLKLGMKILAQHFRFFYMESLGMCKIFEIEDLYILSSLDVYIVGD